MFACVAYVCCQLGRQHLLMLILLCISLRCGRTCVCSPLELNMELSLVCLSVTHTAHTSKQAHAYTTHTHLHFYASIAHIRTLTHTLTNIIYMYHVQGDKLRFVLPTVVAPRYGALPPDPALANQIVAKSSVANAPERKDASKLPYSLSIRYDVLMSSNITKVHSPTHPINFTYTFPTKASLEQQTQSLTLNQLAGTYVCCIWSFLLFSTVNCTLG